MNIGSYTRKDRRLKAGGLRLKLNRIISWFKTAAEELICQSHKLCVKTALWPKQYSGLTWLLGQ